jgi:hypothetical protein
MLGAILAFWLLFNIFYNEKAVAFGPTILTTLGIFAMESPSASLNLTPTIYKPACPPS